MNVIPTLVSTSAGMPVSQASTSIASHPAVTSSSPQPVPATTGVASVQPVTASTAGPSRGGVIVGVVGSAGTISEGQEHGPRGNGKRKRELEEAVQEPGSSLEPPSSKKRHIRLRPRAQVTASTLQAPDTQGSSSSVDTMPKVYDFFS